MYCKDCNHLGFVIMIQNGYVYVFDCRCVTREIYGDIPRYFVEDKLKAKENENV